MGYTTRPTRHTMLLAKNRVIRRRAVVGLLLAASLVLLTLSFREGSRGVIGSIQRSALSITAPFSDAAHRVTQPFVDAWDWAAGLVDARQEVERLQEEVDRAAVDTVSYQQQVEENRRLKALLNYQEATPYETVAAAVIAQFPIGYGHTVTLDVGSNDGVHLDDPVVAPAGEGAGLIGRVQHVTADACIVLLITDRDSAVTARVQGGTAKGLIVPSEGDPGVLSLELVRNDEVVSNGDVVVTAGYRSGGLSALLPPGIPIGVVSSWHLSDVSAYKTVQVTPLVDFENLSDVLVLKVQRDS